MTEGELRDRLELALLGESPESAVQLAGLRYGQARTVRNALDGTSGFGRKALGILLMLDPDAGPMVLEYLRGLVSKEGVHDPRD